jgi:hypothetical protein
MDEFLVTRDAMRPASPREECFYCQSPIGTPHKDTCVLIGKTAHIRITIECPVTVPASWDEETTRFHFNQGTWCATNILGDLERLAEKNDGCLCPFTTIEVVSFDDDLRLSENA